jgi:hypothetical protein
MKYLMPLLSLVILPTAHAGDVRGAREFGAFRRLAVQVGLAVEPGSPPLAFRLDDSCQNNVIRLHRSDDVETDGPWFVFTFEDHVERAAIAFVEDKLLEAARAFRGGNENLARALLTQVRYSCSHVLNQMARLDLTDRSQKLLNEEHERVRLERAAAAAAH